MSNGGGGVSHRLSRQQVDGAVDVFDGDATADVTLGGLDVDFAEQVDDAGLLELVLVRVEPEEAEHLGRRCRHRHVRR